MVVIEEMRFSGFPGRDQDGLRHLTYAGRVAWFRYRFNLVFLTPFQRFVALEGPDCYSSSNAAQSTSALYRRERCLRFWRTRAE
jgi:hypothetical protein